MTIAQRQMSENQKQNNYQNNISIPINTTITNDDGRWQRYKVNHAKTKLFDMNFQRPPYQFRWRWCYSWNSHAFQIELLNKFNIVKKDTNTYAYVYVYVYIYVDNFRLEFHVKHTNSLDYKNNKKYFIYPSSHYCLLAVFFQKDVFKFLNLIQNICISIEICINICNCFE